MKRFNITAKKPYQKQDGSQGNKFIKIGTLIQKDDGGMFGEIDSLPVGTWFDGNIQIFSQDNQGQNNQNTSSNSYGNNQGTYNPSKYGASQNGRF